MREDRLFSKDIDDELETLTVLRDRGRLTDAEFERRAVVAVCRRAGSFRLAAAAAG